MPGRPTGTYEFRGDDETVRIAVWNTGSPGPEGESRFAGREVPPLPNRTEVDEERAVQWYHEADASTAATLRPETERLDLDGAMNFELVYNARESSGCGHWNVYKLVGGEWFHVGPTFHTADCRSIAPGSRMDWTLRAFNGRPVRCGCADGLSGCASGLTRGYLGPGVYGVVTGYGHPADETGALVELEGEPVAIEPTEDATIERDGAEVVVTTGNYGDGEDPPDATLVVERSGDGADGNDPDHVIAEQLMASESSYGRSSALRNAVSVFEDAVERVEVRSDEYDVEDAVGREGSHRRIEVRGRIYELTAEFDEG
jgi:hypothetical protein